MPTDGTNGRASPHSRPRRWPSRRLHLSLGQEAWGHVVARLLAELPIPAAADLADKAKVLDNFYVATRYANGHVEGAPFEH
jgi:HEPN domain-containing protein